MMYHDPIYLSDALAKLKLQKLVLSGGVSTLQLHGGVLVISDRVYQKNLPFFSLETINTDRKN